MKRVPILLILTLAGLVAAGCGPMHAPLPTRLNAEDQKSVDESWNKALSPVGRFDHQGLLDVLLVSNAYQFGVDRLTFRSEKRVDIGTVVMEVEYDRLEPTKDRFEVQLLGKNGQVIRRELYGREEIERTGKELTSDVEMLRAKKANGTATPEELKKLADYEVRLKAIEEVFPKPREKDAAEGPKL
jgi:hypothetical protein